VRGAGQGTATLFKQPDTGQTVELLLEDLTDEASAPTTTRHTIDLTHEIVVDLNVPSHGFTISTDDGTFSITDEFDAAADCGGWLSRATIRKTATPGNWEVFPLALRVFLE
jgi:hypothetical protein